MKENNSKIVTIKRTIPFSQQANMDVTEYFSGASRGIGAYFKRGSAKSGSGLEFNEIKLLMPIIINLESSDRDFMKKVDDYFTDITTRIPHDGLPLEIGLKVNNDSALSEDNFPLNIEQYVKYRHAMSHPDMANSKEEAEGNQLKKFYLVDAEKTLENEKSTNDIRDQAMTEYLSIKGDKNKVDMVYTNIVLEYKNLSFNEKVMYLREYIEDNDIAKAKNFIKIAQDKDLNIKYGINKLIQANILRRVGNAIVITESGTSIGKDMIDAVVWFKDQTNSDTIGVLKARLQEFAKKDKEEITE